MQVYVILGILFTAHCSLTNLAVACMHMLLLVNHVAIASPCAVHALACVHAQLLQGLGQPSPYVAGGHGLFSKLLGACFQWPDDEIGDGLACYSIMIHGLLQPGGKAHYVTSQGNLAMTSLLFFGGVWQ